jgi:hypothetical protein
MLSGPRLKKSKTVQQEWQFARLSGHDPGNTVLIVSQAVSQCCAQGAVLLCSIHHPSAYQLAITFLYERLLAPPFMSHAYPTASSSSNQASNFQVILINAVDKYKKRTKKDLLKHPLVTELQYCNSPSAIIAVLQQQLQGLDQSRRNDERWTRWLDPTVNVLYTLSGTLGEGVGLVRFRS